MEVYKKLKKLQNFEISNKGNIRDINSKEIVKQRLTSDGYNVVYIKNKDCYPKLRVHRLVYETFHNVDIKGKEIDHIDGNKQNNSLDNLEIVSHKENMIKAVKINLLTIIDL